MLNIQNLEVSMGDKPILKGLNLSIGPGEVHAIMGPNGSGKSTLANVLAGLDTYTITHGTMTFEETVLNELSPEERAQLGLFLSFQYPVEIPGVSNVHMLKTALNSLREGRGESKLDAMDFLAQVKAHLKTMEMPEDMLYRAVNEGFSGGEKKRNEILQMLVLNPKLAILDETDSGLDIDALQVVSKGINTLKDGKRSVLLITHYQRLLNHVVPDYVHILAGGRIIASGDATLAHALEENGYQQFLKDNS